jgi:NADH:ubiquinone oxidoreductase subunit E
VQKKSLIEKLHDLQNDQKNTNHLPTNQLVEISKENDTPLAEIYGVATFYTMFSVAPRGRHIIRVCENQACHMAGAVNIVESLMHHLGIAFGETTADGLFTLEHSSCLGMCSIAPCMMIDEHPYGNLTPSRIVEIINKIKAGE